MKKIILLIAVILIFIMNLQAKADEETLIIFDASISMLEPFDGSPKYISAIKQAKSVLNTLPETQKIGLRTIGVSVDTALLSLLQNPDNLCKATNLVVPINSYSAEKINSSLDAIFPLGTTPLEYALASAVNNDFSRNYNTKKHIILITDGADSCNGDPCRYIRELMSKRNDIKVDIIAIGINADDFSQLNCITSSTSGALLKVNNTQDLNLAFQSLLKPGKHPDINYIKTGSLNKQQTTKYKNYTFQFYN